MCYLKYIFFFTFPSHDITWLTLPTDVFESDKKYFLFGLAFWATDGRIRVMMCTTATTMEQHSELVIATAIVVVCTSPLKKITSCTAQRNKSLSTSVILTVQSASVTQSDIRLDLYTGIWKMVCSVLYILCSVCLLQMCIHGTKHAMPMWVYETKLWTMYKIQTPWIKAKYKT